MRPYYVSRIHGPTNRFWTIKGAWKCLGNVQDGFLYYYIHGEWELLAFKENGRLTIKSAYHLYFDTGMID